MFMAEFADEKTEAPTLRRREEARRQGQVARSSDLTAAVLLLAGVGLLKWFGLDVLTALQLCLTDLLGPDSMANVGTDFAWQHSLHLLAAVGISLLPIAAGMVAVAVAINLAQVGFHVNFARVTPNLEMLNPARGFGRIFAAPNAMHLAMGLLKIGLVAWLTYTAIAGRLTQIVGLQQVTFAQVLVFGGDIVVAIAWRVGGLLLVLGLLDYGYQRYRHERDLRMTRREVKEEMKQMEGDPRIRRRRMLSPTPAPTPTLPRSTGGGGKTVGPQIGN